MNQRASFVLAKYCERRYLVILVDMHQAKISNLDFSKTSLRYETNFGLHVCFSKRLTVRRKLMEKCGNMMSSCHANINPRREAIQN